MNSIPQQDDADIKLRGLQTDDLEVPFEAFLCLIFIFSNAHVEWLQCFNIFANSLSF